MRADVADISPARGFIAEHAHYMDDAGFWEAHAARLGGPVIDLGAAASEPVMMTGDLQQLTALLDNLVENALRYTPRGGRVDAPGGGLSVRVLFPR